MRYLAALFVLAACTSPGLPTPQPIPEQSVTLTASVTQGQTPLTVTFTAAANPAAGTFRWDISGKVQTETSDTLTTTFNGSGLYTVRVSVNGASESLTVKATAPDIPNPGPAPDALSLTATPGGPAPWAVRYTVDPAVEGLEARCRESAAFQGVQEGVFACVHEPGDTARVRFVRPDGEVTAEAEASPEVTRNEGVAFAGRWRYSSRGVTETLEIAQGDASVGESSDGRFKLFTIKEDGATVVEFTIDGRTVVLTPTPEDDGRQVYEGRVYGLVLEPVTD